MAYLKTPHGKGIVGPEQTKKITLRRVIEK
jgi:hypothetical protein